jgi:glycosyltransferase involved in cell wall biosynthesis
MKISILTPSYNSVRYLDRAIASVISQDYKNWEHIIMDAASQDGTIAILKKYSHLIWESEKDKGQSDAMNKAFAKATGDIIIYLNADDELEPGWFSKLVKIFQEREDVDIVVGNLRVDKESTCSVKRPSIALSSILQYWPCRFPLNPVSYAYRKCLQEKIGPFPVDNHYTMDYWFLLRAYLHGNIFYVNETGGTFYFDMNNKSADGERAKANLKIVRDQFIRENFFNPSVLAFLARTGIMFFPRKLKSVMRKL